VYVLYDYSSAFNFHGKMIPGGFTTTEAGRNVIEVRVGSVVDPASVDPAVSDPSTLSQTGVGPLMTPPWHIGSPAPKTGANQTLEAVLVDGMLTPAGELSETEIVASSNTGLNQTALDQAAKQRTWRGEQASQPGATPQSHEVFLLMEFAVPAT
jgi:hypothetical protein